MWVEAINIAPFQYIEILIAEQGIAIIEIPINSSSDVCCCHGVDESPQTISPKKTSRSDSPGAEALVIIDI